VRPVTRARARAVDVCPTLVCACARVLVCSCARQSEEDEPTRTACEEGVPRLLGHAPFVRAVTSFAEHEELSPRTLVDAMILPMADAMRQQASEPQVQMTMSASPPCLTLAASCPPLPRSSHGAPRPLCAPSPAARLHPRATLVGRPLAPRPSSRVVYVRTRVSPRVCGVAVRVLGALGCEPLYASDECRGAIVLVLSEMLSVDGAPSTEHSLCLQLIEAIAHSQPTVTAGGAAGAVEPPMGAGASASASTGAGGAPPCTIAGLCRRLAPHLAPRWIWWLVRHPSLIDAVARSLCDTELRSLLALLAPRAVPRIVLVGALDLPFEGGGAVAGVAAGVAPGARPGSAAAARLSVPDAEDYAELASSVLQELAAGLGTTVKALLAEHMHLILAEVFTQWAAEPADDGGEMVCVMPNALAFMYNHGIRRDEFPISGMIRMCARELFQEMVTRLGRAHGPTETGTLLMALNLLLPCGLLVGELADAASVSAVMLTQGAHAHPPASRHAPTTTR
jgi:hypothetical protein